ncbi:uncharacterized protein LOC112171105 [Rosa chinensis]|uniref:uncharacterized protein LOC112171105 n=1 Tax=Rosa chinensis TaxID=74649 RepID=UPI000D08A77F|nr:uncharacterized protein LOC112171105 [Rosa chinensis]
MGKDSDSFHKNAVRACDDLMKQPQHIQNVVENYTSKQIADNRLRVKTSIEAVRWLAFQGCAFRGHDESVDSINPGNFVKLLELLASYNEKVAEVILQNAPRNASYTLPKIQKQMLQAFSVRVKKAIREEINDSKFCIIVDEARDESKKEQMAIVLRFVDKDGFIRERFFGLVHVSDTKASTLQKGIYSVLSNHNLDIQNIRGQGYDGASNMRGKSPQAGDADSAYESMTSYQFVFILHLMEEIMENTNELCLALLSQSQDILNAMSLVSSTKAFIQKLRDNGWDTLFAKVNSFCEACNIDILDMNAHYVGRGGRARHQQDDWTVQHYYQADIFYAAIDSQLQELNNRFNEHAVELFILSSALDPSEISKCFKIDAICKLVEKFYPHDFADHEKLQLKK